MEDPQVVIAALIDQYPALANADDQEILEYACALDPAVWSEVKRGYRNAEYHYEWYDLSMEARRLAVLAAREHAKSEIFSVNNCSWRSIYRPGYWSYVFCNSGDQGAKILGRIVNAVNQTNPELVEGAKVAHTREIVFANDARVTVAGSGAAVRGAHPDLIVGDDVQDENNTATNMQRERLKQWWFGTVGGMAHPGTKRTLANGTMVEFPATQILLVGTPFHAMDLLMSCRENEMYEWKIYGAALPLEELAG